MPELLFNPAEYPSLTYSDAFLVPRNTVVERLYEVASQQEVRKVLRLMKKSEAARAESAAFLAEKKKGNPALQRNALDAHIAFRSYVLELADTYPDLKKVVSRDDVDITPTDGFGNVPIVVANMNGVTGKRMAETATRMGASAAISQDKTDEELEDIIDNQHTRHLVYDTGVIVTAKTKVHELERLIPKRDNDTAIVVDESGVFVGLIRLPKEEEKGGKDGVVPKGANADRRISQYVRRTDLVWGEDGISPRDAIEKMDAARVDFLPILTPDRRVKGVLTRKAAAMSWRYKANEDPVNGGLSVLAAVPAVNQNPVDRVKFLIDKGVRGIIFDTAHFDQGVQTYRNVEMARRLIERSRQKILLVAGNVITREGVRDIFAAGADVGKTGIGPGALCTTRIKTANGEPQLSAVQRTAEEAAIYGKHIWADGGIVHPRDVALALALGASQVMIGSLFASTYESPPDLQKDEHGYYKQGHGMASRQASELRTIQRLERSMRDIFREAVGHRAEGLSDAKMYQKEELRSTADVIHWIMDGVTSAMTYAGARNMAEFARFARIGIQMPSGFDEGKAKTIF